MGVTTGDIGLFRLSRITPAYRLPAGQAGSGRHHASPVTVVIDGSLKGNVWGTYIHGLFDNDSFRKALLNSLRYRKGLPPIKETINYFDLKETAINRWADILRNSVDICFILRLLDMEYCKEHLIKNNK